MTDPLFTIWESANLKPPQNQKPPKKQNILTIEVTDILLSISNKNLSVMNRANLCKNVTFLMGK